MRNHSSSTKSLITLLGVLSLASCASNDQEPDWYRQQHYTPTNNEYIGYGSGNSPQGAEAQALAHIARSLSSHVRTSDLSHTSVQSGKVDDSFESNVQLSSDLRLANAKKIELEEMDGRYFAVYSYRNLTLNQRIKAELGDKVQCASHSHPYLDKTPLLQELKADFGCLPDIAVFQQHAQFSLSAGGKNFSLSPQEQQKLFSSVSSDHIDLELSANSIESEQFYSIEVQSGNKGYLSLAQQYADGSTQILLDNQEISRGQVMTYPDLNQYNGLEAYNPSNVPIRDVTFAILCSDPIDIKGIPEIDIKFTQSQVSFFHFLMDRTTNCEISSRVQTIYPRTTN